MTAPFQPPHDFVSSYLQTYGRLLEGSVQIPAIPQPSGQPQLASRNNNPGNLQYADQQGALPGDKGFARFESPEAGYQALLHQIQLDQSRGLPLGAFIAKYAPPASNDTATYVQRAAQRFGISPGTPIHLIPPTDLAKFIAQQESQTHVSEPSNPSMPWLQPPQPPQGPYHPGGGASF